jgi:hypothetical protein
LTDTDAVIVKNPADFVGSVIGESEKKTKGILAATAGKVLVIDEFYSLYGGGTARATGGDTYRTAVIDTIVAEVQSTPGDDRCVLLLGYKDQLEDMFQNVNPGLTRRFPLDSAFVFEDFTDDELRQILNLKLKEQGLDTTDQAKNTAMEMLSRARNRPHFGNAGEIDILLTNAKSRLQKRLSAGNGCSNSAILEAYDFDEDFDRMDRADTNLSMLFEGVIGCEGVVDKLEGYRQTAKNMRKLDMDPREHVPFNFLFRGPPGKNIEQSLINQEMLISTHLGTGKTTTARKIGKVYYDMGLVATAEVIECSATDLVGQYVGQTGPKTQKTLEKALGKVLFIDEAYRLAEGHFALEAMDEIVDAITKPKFTRKLIIILAGYDADINRLMAINPGLTSRFPETLVFRSFTAVECMLLFTQLLQRQKKELARRGKYLDITVLEFPRDSFLSQWKDRFAVLSKLPSWANARDIETLAKSTFSKVMKSPELLSQGNVTIDEETVLSEADAMVTERAHRSAVVTQRHKRIIEPSNAALQATSEHSPKVSVTSTSTSNTEVKAATKAAHEKSPLPTSLKTNSQPLADETLRDAGVTDEVWHRLQQDKLASQSRHEGYEKLIETERSLQRSVGEAEAKAVEDIVRLNASGAMPAQYEKERLQHEKERRAREAELAELERKRQFMEEEREKERQAQKRLREMGVCSQGFRWIKQASGYRCAGGSHFVSDEQLSR